MVLVTVRIVVSGKVQGVSFRSSLRDIAVLNELDGWVRNNADGTVEALLQGDEPGVKAVTEWAQHGPPNARVASVSRQKLNVRHEKPGFEIMG